MYKRQIPVFAKAGAIVPLTDNAEACKNGTALPQSLTLRVFAGADGTFTLYEDDGLTNAYLDGQGVTTELRFRWKTDTDASVFSVVPDSNGASFLPASRQYTVCFTGVNDIGHVIVKSKDTEIIETKEYDESSRTLSITIPAQPVNECIEICFPEGLSLAKNRTTESLYALLNDCTIAYEQKEQIYRTVLSAADPALAICELQTMQSVSYTHLNVTITLVENPWDDYFTKLPLALQGNDGPAIFNVHNSKHDLLIDYMAPYDIPVEDLEADFVGVSGHLVDGKVYYTDYGLSLIHISSSDAISRCNS